MLSFFNFFFKNNLRQKAFFFSLLLFSLFWLDSAFSKDYGYLNAEDQKYYKNEAGQGFNQLERIDSLVKEVNKIYGELNSTKAEVERLKKEVEELKAKK